MQGFLREDDFSVTVTAVNYDEIMSRKPKRITKTYQRLINQQLRFVDYTINLAKRNALGKVEESGEPVEEIEIVFPLIFPENAEVLPIVLEYVKQMKLELYEKCVNGERATYLIQGKIRLKE